MNGYAKYDKIILPVLVFSGHFMIFIFVSIPKTAPLSSKGLTQLRKCYLRIFTKIKKASSENTSDLVGIYHPNIA